MTGELDYPVEREMQVREESGKTKYESDTRLFRPRPYGRDNKDKADNKLFVLPFTFNQFEWFANWPALRNYYLTLFVHQINEVNDSGTLQRRFVICEPSMNKYATEKLSDSSRVVPVPFPNPGVCAFCKKSQDFWNKYKEQKKAAGIENLTSDGFKKAMDQHPEIKATRELAIEWQAAEKFYFLVFDYSRWLGETPREKDDDGSCGIQAYIGPQALVEGLYAEQKAKSRFWDFAGGKGRAIIFTRDNTRGARFCKYSVKAEHEAPELDGETTGYLQDPPAEDLFDPSLFIRRLSPEQKNNYVKEYGAGSPTAQEDSSSAGDSEPETRSEAQSLEEAPPAAEVKSTGRPRARTTAPSTPPPATAAPAAQAAPASAVDAPAPASQEAPPPPAAEGTAAPKRSKVTWRK